MSCLSLVRGEGKGGGVLRRKLPPSGPAGSAVRGRERFDRAPVECEFDAFQFTAE